MQESKTPAQAWQKHQTAALHHLWTPGDNQSENDASQTHCALSWSTEGKVLAVQSLLHLTSELQVGLVDVLFLGLLGLVNEFAFHTG